VRLLVGGKDATAGSYHFDGDFVEICKIHLQLLSALTPGSSLPSNHSRKAPPAVEM
jgi:hypothetical protein